MTYPIYSTLSTLEFELRRHPQWPFGLLDLEDYLVLEPENDEAEKLLNAMEEHGYLPCTYSWISSNGRKERLYRRLPGFTSRRVVAGGAGLVFRTGRRSHPVAASPARAKDYANTGDPSMLVPKPAPFPNKAIQAILTLEILGQAVCQPN